MMDTAPPGQRELCAPGGAARVPFDLRSSMAELPGLCAPPCAPRGQRPLAATSGSPGSSFPTRRLAASRVRAPTICHCTPSAPHSRARCLVGAGARPDSWALRASVEAATSGTQTQLSGEETAERPAGKVKICGITREEDAAAAAEAGAGFAGMILWPKARRHVELATARSIAAAARAGGAEPVGVFVDAGAEEIERVCAQVGLHVAQLHGDASRAALPSLPGSLRTIFVAHVDTAGRIVTPLPTPDALPDWLLLDGLKGGSGVTIDWARVEVPRGCYKQGWILAGGLTPANVAAAISALAPDVVDVSSGVCGPDKLAKDHVLIREFVASALEPRTFEQ